MSDQHPDASVPPGGVPDGFAPPPAGVPTRRSRSKAVLTAMAGLLVVGTVGYGIVSLSEGDGAASPEAAVEDLFEAVDRQDAIGVAESLEPTERRILVDALEDAKSEAERVHLTDDRLDLRAVDGVDLSVDGLQLQTTPLDDETYAVDITSGQISSRAQLSKMPIGSVVQEVIDRNEEAGGDAGGTSEDRIELSGTRLVAVERGGSWYVSALYSLAEQIRLDGDPVAAYPSAGSAIPAVGADSPEAAVREGVEAAAGADIRRLIELTPAEEARVLHTYGPILVDEAQGEDTGVTVDDLELEVADAPGGRKVVSATSMTMTITTDWDRQTTTYDGTCSTTTWETTDPEYAIGDDGETTDTWKWCDDDIAKLSPFGWFSMFSAPGDLDVIVEQHDGKWFLSPSATIIENTVGAVKDLDADDVRRVARAWGGEWWLYEPAELWKACGVDEPSLDDSRSDAEAAYEQCMKSLPDDYAGPWGPFGGWSITGVGDEGFGDVGSVPGDECYATGSGSMDDMPSMDDIDACLAGLVAAGELDPSELASFRCGRIYDDLPDGEGDLSDAEVDALWKDADARYDACIDDAEAAGGGSGGGVSFGSGGSTPNDTSTTRPPATPTTTAPAKPKPTATTSTTRPTGATATTAPVTTTTRPAG